MDEALSVWTSFDTLWNGSLLRIDAEGPVITSIFGSNRLHYDGTTLWYQNLQGDRNDPTASSATHPPRALDLAHPTAVAELWDELRAGFANSTFTRAAPEFDPDFRHSRNTYAVWYRVDLPFTWDDGVEIYAWVNHGPTRSNLGHVRVYDRKTRKLLTLPPACDTCPPVDLPVPSVDPRGEYWAVDVPLGPDAYSPTFAVSSEVPYGFEPERAVLQDLGGNPGPFFVERYRVRLVPDFSRSWSETTRRETADTARVLRLEKCEGVGTHRTSAHLVWSMGSEPATHARYRDALKHCASPTLEVRPTLDLRAEVEGRACLEGTWVVVDARSPEKVLQTLEIDSCVEGPGSRRVDGDLVEPLTLTKHADGVEVQFTGTATVVCSEEPGWVSASFDGTRKDTVMVDLGCGNQAPTGQP